MLLPHQRRALIDGHYTSLLSLDGEALRPFFSSFHWEGRPKKGLAVSKDGKVMRVYTTSSYNDTFRSTVGGGVVLHYVCGITEELRRQRLNRKGDPVRVILTNRRNDRHAVLRGVFREVRVTKEYFEDGEFHTREYSLIDILGFDGDNEEEESRVSHKRRLTDDTADGEDDDGHLAGEDFPHEALHLVFGVSQVTASSMRLSYAITTSDFELRICTHETDLDEEQPLQASESVHAFFEAVARIAGSGGCLVSHNTEQYLDQIHKVALACGSVPTRCTVRAFDSMRSAPRIMQLMQCHTSDKCMSLRDLATHNKVFIPHELEAPEVVVLCYILRSWPIETIATLTKETHI